MGENIKDNEQENLSQPPLSAQEEEAETPLKRLRIHPRNVLESLGHLRIEKTRIKPIENTTPKEGGNADVEAAILVPPESSDASESEDTEYVAVKKLRFDTDTKDDQVLAPFAHEISLLNDLADENVVKIIGFVEDVVNGDAWMIFSWEKNGNLREFVRSANWELPERVSLLNDVANGLSYLHGRTPPICHGDLKSLNILVNCENRAIITDFGSARTMDTTVESPVRGGNPPVATKSQYLSPSDSSEMQSLKAELAASGAFITVTGPAWTIRWAAPELLEGKLPGLASDIWALGWICWEAITGNFPFAEENDISVVLRITQGDLPAVSDNAQLKEIKVLCSLMGECWRLEANERPTAMRCQQVISFMYHVVPSSGGEGNSMTTTRSSGLLHALGQIQQRNGMMPEARKYFGESFEVAKSVGDEEGMARALRAQGDVCYLQDEYGVAEYSYIQARALYSRIGDQPGFAQCFKALGDVYRMKSDYAKAEESYVQARDIYSQIDDQVGFANSVKGLGDVYYMRDEYSKAEESYIQARDICSQIGDQLGFAHSVHRLGEVYRMRNEYSKAVDSYVQSRDLYSQIGSQLGFVQSVQALGDMYRIQEQYSAAEESYLRARDIYSQIGSQLGYAQSLQGLGEVYLMRGKYSKAEESYIEARNVYSQIGDQLGFAQSVQALGYLYCL